MKKNSAAKTAAFPTTKAISALITALYVSMRRPSGTRHFRDDPGSLVGMVRPRLVAAIESGRARRIARLRCEQLAELSHTLRGHGPNLPATALTPNGNGEGDAAALQNRLQQIAH
jgi:hypothetical protein